MLSVATTFTEMSNRNYMAQFAMLIFFYVLASISLKVMLLEPLSLVACEDRSILELIFWVHFHYEND